MFLFILQSAAELLGCQPDVACFGKLLTGGVVPLAVTLATESVFEAFQGDSKVFDFTVKLHRTSFYYSDSY